MEKAMIRKLTTAVIKFPYLMEAPPTVNTILEKSTLLVTMDTAGMIISLTRELIMDWKAPPDHNTDC